MLSTTEKSAFVWAALSVCVIATFGIYPVVWSGEDAVRAEFDRVHQKCATCTDFVDPSTGLRASVASSISQLAPTAEGLHNMPRFTFTGQPAPNTFSFNLDYLQGIGVLAIWGPIIAILCLLVWPVVLCCRGCCNCCGDSKSTRSNGYTKKEVNLTRIALIVLIALAGVGCVVGIAGNAMFSTALSDSFNRIYIISGGIRNIGTNLQSLAAAGLRNNTVTFPTTALNQFDQAVVSVESGTKAVKDLVMSYDTGRLVAMSLAYVISAIAGAFGLMSIILRKGFFCWIMVLIMWVSLFVMWLLFAVNFVIAVLLADLCYAIGENATTSLSVLLICNSALKTASSTVMSFVNTQITLTDNAISTLPATNVYRIKLEGEKATLQKLATDLATTLNCGFVQTAFDGLKTDICVTMLSSITMLFVGALIMGVAWFFGMFVALMGVKRFDKDQSRERKDEFSEMESF